MEGWKKGDILVHKDDEFTLIKFIKKDDTQCGYFYSIGITHSIHEYNEKISNGWHFYWWKKSKCYNSPLYKALTGDANEDV